MGLCYKDKAYCWSDCVNTTCDRFVSDELRKEAAEFGLPLSLINFSAKCPGYKKEN
jgi:hypothetical protein